MSSRHIFFLSASVRVLFVVVAVGLVFVRCIKSVETVVELPMIEAASEGQVSRLKALIDAGSDVNIVDKDGNTPLALAVFGAIYPQNREIIELLLQNGAHVRIRNKVGQAPLLFTMKIDYKELRMQMIGKLIKFGAIMREEDNKGFDLLQKNVESYDRTTTQMMLDWWGRLISPDMLAKAKKRALDYNLRDILDILNQGVKGIVQNAYWNPAIIDPRTGLNDLHFAVINNDQPLVKTILGRGVNINQASEDEYGMRPLHYAVLHYSPEMVDYLIEHKANVNTIALNGNTPLHMLAWLGNPDTAHTIADALLKAGAHLNVQNKNGDTLLHMLIKTNNQDLINHINKNYDFNVNIPNESHESPRQLAERLDRLDLLRGVGVNKNASGL